MEFELLWALAKNYGVLQKKEELRQFVEYISMNNINGSYLEIGINGGGTTAVFSRLFKFGVSIDYELRANLNELKAYNTNIHFGKFNSHSQEAINYVKSFNTKFDLLFIDADHSFKSCVQDYYNYKNYVKKGGIIVFHDIFVKGILFGQEVYVKDFWDILKNDYDYKEIISKDGEIDCWIGNDYGYNWGGIGIIKKPFD